MRADRLLSILMLLQIRGRITAHELAKRLEVSERTIYRDIEALGMAGVPVYTEPGPGGGCMLAEGYRTNLTGLTEDEVRTLFLPGMSRPLQDLGAGKALDAALLKLQAALPSAHRRDVEHASQRLYMDVVGWFYVGEMAPFLPTLRDAVWQDRKVQLTYRKSDGEIVERLVDPLGLVVKAGIWYVVVVTHGELRNFRVSRVQHALITEEPCQRPAGFDLETYWTTSNAEFQAHLPNYTVKVRVSPTFISILPQLWGDEIYKLIEEAPPADAEGWIILPLTFSSFELARSNILGYGTMVEVLEPQELRDSVLVFARGIVDFYEREAVSYER